MARIVCMLACTAVLAGAGAALSGKPPVEESAQVARWLVHEVAWGTLATLSEHLHGTPYGRARTAHAPGREQALGPA